MQNCIDNIRSWMEHKKLSSREMWTQRDQFSNQQLPLADDHLTALQHEQHLSNHPDSDCSKAPLRNRHPTPLIDVGDLVYLHSDRNKSRARDRYLVVAIDPRFCDIKKFIGSQLRSSPYRVKLTECFKVPSDLADPLHAPYQCRGQDSDDEDINNLTFGATVEVQMCSGKTLHVFHSIRTCFFVLCPMVLKH